MRKKGTYADYSTSTELERDVGDAINYYIKGFNQIISY